MNSPTKHIYLPIIAFDQNVNGYFMLSLIELILLLKQHNYNVSVDPIFFESLIPRARNASVIKFLENEAATHLIFIDTDIMFKPHDIIKLIETDLPVVGASYPKKYLKDKSANYPVDFTINGSIKKTEYEYIYEADYLPTGFLSIKKEVFQSIIEKNIVNKYINNIDGYSTKSNVFYDFFQCTIDPVTNYYLSEDYSFCNLCKHAGINKYVYSNIPLRHIGKHMFEGNLEEYLQVMHNN